MRSCPASRRSDEGCGGRGWGDGSRAYVEGSIKEFVVMEAATYEGKPDGVLGRQTADPHRRIICDHELFRSRPSGAVGRAGSLMVGRARRLPSAS